MNFKRIITGLMAVCVMGTVLPSLGGKTVDNAVITASAVDRYKSGTYGQLTYYVYSDYISITQCESSATSIVIPAEIDGVPVTSIGAWSFMHCKDLTEIIIPDSITSIDIHAFGDCSGLTSIELPDSVTEIRDYAFANCLGITSINIPQSVKSIGASAFVACSNMDSIIILNPDCDIDDDIWTFAFDAVFDGNVSYHLTGSKEQYSGTIYGYENSTAQEYAEKYNRKFVSLGRAPKKDPEMGDIDADGKIDSSDASLVLSEYSLLSTGKNGNFSEDEKKRADLNKDETIDSSDASLILAYYSHTSTGGTDSIEDFLEKNK